MRYIYVKYYAYAVWPIEMKMQCTSKHFQVHVACKMYVCICVCMCVCVGASVCVCMRLSSAIFLCSIYIFSIFMQSQQQQLQ